MCLFTLHVRTPISLLDMTSVTCGSVQVHGALYSYVDPTPSGTQPYLVAAAPAVAQLVGLKPGAESIKIYFTTSPLFLLYVLIIYIC